MDAGVFTWRIKLGLLGRYAWVAVVGGCACGASGLLETFAGVEASDEFAFVVDGL